MKRRGFLQFLGIAPAAVVPAVISKAEATRAPARIPGVEEMRAWARRQYEQHDAKYARAHTPPDVGLGTGQTDIELYYPIDNELYAAAGQTPGDLSRMVAEWKAKEARYEAVKLEMERVDSVRQQGADAWSTGMQATQNPYPDRSDDFYGWYFGWTGGKFYHDGTRRS